MLTQSWPILILLALTLLVPVPAEEKAPEEKAAEEKDDTKVLDPIATEYDPTSKPELEATAKRVVERTNQLRQNKNLARLKINPELLKSAASFAGYMARSRRYGHRADGKRADERAEKNGYDPCIVGENLAYAYRAAGFTTDELADKLFEGWRSSPEHLRNMLDPDVIETAVALEAGESGYHFAVQLFGRPKSLAIRFKLANESDVTFEYRMSDEKLKLAPGELRTHLVCRAQDLVFQWRDKTNDQTVQAKDGDTFTVTREGELFQVRKK